VAPMIQHHPVTARLPSILRESRVDDDGGVLPSCSACMIKLFQHHENSNQCALPPEGLPVSLAEIIALPLFWLTHRSQ